MKPQPFCCDITSGTTEEQIEFKRLFVKASKQDWYFMNRHYGYDLTGIFSFGFNRENALIHFFTRIIPLSEGIAILKQMVGEEEKGERKLEVIEVDKLEAGDVFLWKSKLTKCFEIHTFHSDSGYGAKTFTNYNEKDGSSTIVNYSGICGVIKVKQPIS